MAKRKVRWLSLDQLDKIDDDKYAISKISWSNPLVRPRVGNCGTHGPHIIMLNVKKIVGMADKHLIAARQTVRKANATAAEIVAACKVLAESADYGDRLIAKAVARQITYDMIADGVTGVETPVRIDLPSADMAQMAEDDEYHDAHSSAVALGLVLLILMFGAAVSAGLVIWAALP